MPTLVYKTCSSAYGTRSSPAAASQLSGDSDLTLRVLEDGVPGQYAVRLYAKNRDQCLAAALSDAGGECRFGRLSHDAAFFVTVFDHGAGPRNGAISDRNLRLTRSFEDC